MIGNAGSIIVMGVCGCGKSTVGRHLAELMNIPFVEGDDFHSAENTARMSAGTPLTDKDRTPWLKSLGELLAGKQIVLSCSALKRQYRDILRKTSGKSLIFIHINVERELLEQRLQARKGHFAGPELLDSQLQTLQVPGTDEPHIIIGPEPDLLALLKDICSIAAM